MAGKIKEGLWDCPYCGQKGIGGLTKSCPGCGHPQDAGTKFYVGTESRYLDNEKAQNYGKGADWTCAYCGSLNRFGSTECSNCGAPREQDSTDYFENRKKQEADAKEKEAQMEELTGERDRKELAAKQAKKKRTVIFAVIAAVLLGLIINAMIPRRKTAEVTELNWYREIGIQEYATVRESGWSIPARGTEISESQEIYAYHSELDHYEEQQVERSREIITGYTDYTYDVDNGDGTFSERTESEPVYETEYYYETETVPVYVQVPEYRTQYVYDIDRWVDAGSEETSGTSEETPEWPELDLGENLREGWRNAEYCMVIETAKGVSYTVSVSEAMWESYSIGDTVELTLTAGGSLTAIDGSSVR